MAIKRTVPLDRQLATLKRKLLSLPKEISGKRGGPLRRALFQGAKIYEQEAESHVHIGKDTDDPGRLKRAIGKERVRKPHLLSPPATEAYFIRPRKGKSRDDPRGAWYWHFEEFGTRFRPAHSFMRKGFDTAGNAPLRRFTEALANDIKKIERKLQRTARGSGFVPGPRS